MLNTKPVILLTGAPEIGKSTAIQALIKQLGGRLGGFYAREVREAGIRIGFEIVTLNGESCVLARRSEIPLFRHEASVGRYKVDLDAVEKVAVPSLQHAIMTHRIVVLDEIAPMQIASELFCETVLNLLNTPSVLTVGTIMERFHPFADEVKKHNRVILEPVTVSNRGNLPHMIYQNLSSYLQEYQ